MKEIIPRRIGTNPLLETKAEAEQKVNKKIRYQQIIEILSESNEPMSAKDLSVEMKNRGYSKTDERNVAAPRITELLQKGILENVGTKVCEYSGSTVGVFTLRQINGN